jgi:hypothetical protein
MKHGDSGFNNLTMGIWHDLAINYHKHGDSWDIVNHQYILSKDWDTNH